MSTLCYDLFYTVNNPNSLTTAKNRNAEFFVLIMGE
nr:MAG TPA: hypothetical protein [Caudoviricetes sp.]